MYALTSVESESLRAEAQLQGHVQENELELVLRLSNTERKALVIREITISTPDGLRSTPLTSLTNMPLLPDADTILQLTFRPVNDLAMYQRTGIQGTLKDRYHVLVLYGDQDDEKDSALALTLNVSEDGSKYLAERTNQEIATYSFHVNEQFQKKQSEYLKRETAASSFTHISEQEINVSGLNVRLKAYEMDDTLHVRLMFVNHADFSVKMDTSRLDISCNRSQREAASKNVEKISGDPDDISLLERGDRLSVALKKPLKQSSAENCFISFKNAVRMNNGNPLFVSDVELVKAETTTL